MHRKPTILVKAVRAVSNFPMLTKKDKSIHREQNQIYFDILINKTGKILTNFYTRNMAGKGFLLFKLAFTF